MKKVRVSVTLNSDLLEIIDGNVASLNISRDKYLANLIISGLQKKHNERGAGRKKSITDDQVAEILSLRSQGINKSEIGRQIGISPTHVTRILKEFES